MAAQPLPQESFQILPSGFLRDASKRDAASAHGVAAVDAGSGDEPSRVRGWGMSGELALAAAARLGFAADTVEVYACSGALFTELGRGERPCSVSLDVAYSVREASPWDIAWPWAEEIFARNRRADRPDRERQAFDFLLDTVLSAYLTGTTSAVGLTEDGIVGWKAEAKTRAKPPAGSAIAPMSTEIVAATVEVADNIETAKDVRAALERQMKKLRRSAGKAH